jgi:hypothetical protein
MHLCHHWVKNKNINSLSYILYLIYDVTYKVINTCFNCWKEDTVLLFIYKCKWHTTFLSYFLAKLFNYKVYTLLTFLCQWQFYFNYWLLASKVLNIKLIVCLIILMLMYFCLVYMFNYSFKFFQFYYIFNFFNNIIYLLIFNI